MQELDLLKDLVSRSKRTTIQKTIQTLSDEDATALLYDWELWARDKQRLPEGDWDTWLINAGRGFGKMLDINTDIRTIDGWKKLNDIQAGDYVFNMNGDKVEVIAAHDIVETDGYKLTFDTGEEITSCADHLWYTIDKLEDKRIRRGKSEGGSVRTTKEIADTVKYLGRETNHRIPVCGSLSFEEKELLVDPYLFGIWLGDGASACGEITCDDYEILDKISTNGHIVKWRNDLQYTIDTRGSVRDSLGRFTDNDSLTSKLKRLNVIRNKHIPSIYQSGSTAQRLELLRGLMDSDGHCDKSGWCEFVSIKKQLANDVFELISSLGIKSRMYINDSKYYGRLKGKKYRIFFKTDIDVFSLERKLNRQKEATKNQICRHKNRFIVSVDKTDRIKMRCLTVDSEDGLFLIGKSFIPTHNTRTGAEVVRQWKNNYPIIHLVAPTASDARDVMVEGESGILAISPPGDRPRYTPSLRRLTWENGSIAIMFSADEPDRLRGPQCYKAWADELASWRYPDAWDQLQFGLRLGDNPQCVITTTPRPTEIIRSLIADERTIVTIGSTFENKANLADSFIRSLMRKYEGTRLGRQEIYAEVLDDFEGALWKSSDLERSRVKEAPAMRRVVVAIDPAVTANKNSDETGIIVVGLGMDNEAYVLDDLSGTYSPNEWGMRAVALYAKHKADRVVAEVNQGGDMVETILRGIDRNISYRSVHATKGKFTRAEPVAALYEQGRVHHVGVLPQLETQMVSWSPQQQKSPDRIDALVWGVTDLMLTGSDTEFWVI